MSIIMRKNNVERIADNDAVKKHLEALGFSEVVPVQPAKVEEPNAEVGEDAAGFEISYDKLKVDELKAIAIERGIEGAESMKKAELIEMLEALDE